LKSLIFSDINNTLLVEYKVDLIGSNLGNFTVMQIKGLTDVDHSLLAMNFKQLNYDVPSFITFANNNFLKLTITDQSKGTSSVLVDATPLSSGGGFPIGKDLL